MRRFFSDAMRHQDRLAEQADRASRTRATDTSDDADLVASIPVSDRARLKGTFATGTKHTGKIIGRRHVGFIIDFGTIKGILPSGKTNGASLKVGDRTRVTVETGYDGTRPPQLTRM